MIGIEPIIIAYETIVLPLNYTTYKYKLNTNFKKIFKKIFKN